jgi:hypothetical protein
MGCRLSDHHRPQSRRSKDQGEGKGSQERLKLGDRERERRNPTRKERKEMGENPDPGPLLKEEEQ